MEKAWINNLYYGDIRGAIWRQGERISLNVLRRRLWSAFAEAKPDCYFYSMKCISVVLSCLETKDGKNYQPCRQKNGASLPGVVLGVKCKFIIPSVMEDSTENLTNFII